MELCRNQKVTFMYWSRKGVGLKSENIEGDLNNGAIYPLGKLLVAELKWCTIVFQFFLWFAETEGQMEQEEGQQQRYLFTRALYI